MIINVRFVVDGPLGVKWYASLRDARLNSTKEDSISRYNILSDSYRYLEQGGCFEKDIYSMHERKEEQ